MRRTGVAALITLLLAIVAIVYTVTAGGHTPQLGLDLQGGTSVVLGAKEGQNASGDQLDRAISIIRRRVDGLGVAEPEITRQGNFIVVSLPGVKDRDRAIAVVGQTAKLQFRPFCGEMQTGLADDQYEQALSASGPYGTCVAPNGSASSGAPAGSTTTPNTPAGQSSVPVEPGAPAPSSDTGSSQNGLGLPPHGHLSAAQAPASTE